MTQQLHFISPKEIHANPYQPRSPDHFDPEKLQELADSIKSVGILHPPIVRPLENGLYELIAGERRFRAAQLAGLKKIPVLIQEQDTLKSALAALIENLQREDLNPIDTAKALKSLSIEFKLTHEEMAKTLGIKRATLSNQIRLLALPEAIQKALIDHEITPGHAKVLLSLDSDPKRLALFQRILQGQLSVRETEELIKKKKKETPPVKNLDSKNIFLQQIQERLQEKLGTKVSFSGSGLEGVLSLHYYNLSDLNRLLNEIGYSEE